MNLGTGNESSTPKVGTFSQREGEIYIFGFRRDYGVHEMGVVKGKLLGGVSVM